MAKIELKIVHRVNTIPQLIKISSEYGVELDLRYEKKNIIIHHDPFVSGELFEDYLKHFKHRMMILNIKSEGIEDEVIRLVEKYGINEYFLLDLSLPLIVKQSKKGQKKIAIRFSEFEPLEFVMKFKGLVDWVWIDSFMTLPLNDTSYLVLKNHFKLCLVSPELQGHSLDRIEEFKKLIEGKNINAVCTKRPDLW